MNLIYNDEFNISFEEFKSKYKLGKYVSFIIVYYNRNTPCLKYSGKIFDTSYANNIITIKYHNDFIDAYTKDVVLIDDIIYEILKYKFNIKLRIIKL